MSSSSSRKKFWSQYKSLVWQKFNTMRSYICTGAQTMSTTNQGVQCRRGQGNWVSTLRICKICYSMYKIMLPLSSTSTLWDTWSSSSRTLIIEISSKLERVQGLSVEVHAHSGRIECLIRNIRQRRILRELNMVWSTWLTIPKEWTVLQATVPLICFWRVTCEEDALWQIWTPVVAMPESEPSNPASTFCKNLMTTSWKAHSRQQKPCKNPPQWQQPTNKSKSTVPSNSPKISSGCTWTRTRWKTRSFWIWFTSLVRCSR